MNKEETENKIRLELEDLTRELVQIGDEKVKLQRKIDRMAANHPKLKETCGEMDKLLANEQIKINRKNHLINLLNVTS